MKDTQLLRVNLKKIVYTICFMALVLIDWVRNNGNGQEWAIAINCIGIVIFLITFLQYKILDFVKLPYVIWYIICICGGSYALIWGSRHVLFYGQWVTAVINICLYGILTIKIISGIVKKEVHINWKNIIFILTFATFIALMVSKSTSIWPIWFFVMFGCFYLTKFSEVEKDYLFDSMLNGVILGFFLLQGLAFVFRPYDQIRYVGMFVNSNANGLFYLLTFCAFLGKTIRERQKSNHPILRLFFLFFSGVTISFAFLTISRVVIASIVVITVIFLILDHFIYSSTKWKGMLKSLMTLGISFFISFGLVFFAVRYLPPFFHHPVWFQGEYSEQKVHSWDKYDSEKFVDLDEFLDHAVYRTLITLGFMEEATQTAAPVTKTIDTVVSAPAVSTPAVSVPAVAPNTIAEILKMRSEFVVAEYKDGIQPGFDAVHPVVNATSAAQFIENSFGIRSFIYQYYLSELSLFGKESTDSGVWLFPDFYCFHTHNSFLQIAYTHGIIAGFLFILLVVVSFIRALYFVWKYKNKSQWYYSLPIFFFMVFILYGQLEIGSFLGQHIFTLLFVLNYLVMNREGPCDVI